MHYDPYYGKESIYIAGPECFYENGYVHWDALAYRAKMMGFKVSMPSDRELKLGNPDLRDDAKAIFDNCIVSMKETTAIIADLEFYRGPEVDGGSLYEAGMAWAKGCSLYGYTRDNRPMKWKYQGGELKGDLVYDRKGRVLPYQDLPFSPNTVSSMKIVEGDFDDALKLFGTDIAEARKQGKELFCEKAVPTVKNEKPVVYLAGPQRFDADAAEKYAAMKALCEGFGLDVITPPDYSALYEGDPFAAAYKIFLQNMENVKNCDIIIADLNDFHGWEPDSDTSFECGVAYWYGKKLFGYMDSTVRMIDRVPNRGEAHEYRDACGCNAENFDYPCNLMFAGGPMPILEGSFEKVIAEAAAQLKAEGIL